MVQRLALEKAKAVAAHHRNAVILGADTVVALNDEIIGKPNSEGEAESTLRTLSNKTHHVFTGIALLKTDDNTRTIQQKLFYVRTTVTFGSLSPSIIKAYIKTGEVMDKAGAYGIQDKWGTIFVKRIEGDYYNIVGLPLHSLYNTLKSFAPELLKL